MKFKTVLTRIKKIKILILVLAVVVPQMTVFTEAVEFTGEIDALSAILVDATTGRVMYEKNADEPLPPASVTKIMTLLLVMEAIDSGTLKYEDTVRVSAYAASMGGSQIYLKENEEMSVNDLIKSVVVASANDSAVALAEHIAGSEAEFVSRMNSRAKELGMANTHFENTNGLDDDVTNHVTSARDISIMSRELIKHEKILEYSSIWMDSVRNGEFGLTNTNRLIRFYSGANGLKTGSTGKAKFCISATAKRDGLQLIAVIMGSPTGDVRNEMAKKLLDFGFANYSYVSFEAGLPEDIKVSSGVKSSVSVEYPAFESVVEKNLGKDIVSEKVFLEDIKAPVTKGQKLGEVIYRAGDTEVGRVDIVAREDVDKITFPILVKMTLEKILLLK